MGDKYALLACGIELRRAILQFNFMPAFYLHPSRREQFFPNMPDKVWLLPRTFNRMSSVILQKLDSPEPFFDLSHWGWPLALLPPDRILQLALHIGAISLRNQVRSSLAREHVLIWKQKLGVDAYHFAMNSASLLPLSGMAEEKIAEMNPDEIGYSVIVSAIETMPEPMLKRTQLKLPVQFRGRDMDSGKARRLITSILDISEGKWSSSLAVTY